MPPHLFAIADTAYRNMLVGRYNYMYCTAAGLKSKQAYDAVTGQLADTPTRGLPTRGLDISRTGQLAV